MTRVKQGPFSSAGLSALVQRGLDALFRPADAAGLVYFRFVFYAIMLWEAYRFIDLDWVRRYFAVDGFQFKFWPFTFVQPWPGNGVTIHIYIMAIVAALALLGLYYRASAAVFFVMITYLFLLEQARYLNHLYLVCLLAFLMIFLPAHRAVSLDAYFAPGSRTGVVGAWSIWLLRFQMGVPYFFGGIAKLNSDWLRGEPMRAWLAARTDFPIIGEYFTEEPVVLLLNYGGLLLDLSVVFFLLFRRTRVFAYIAALVFHFMNSNLFGIGIFPWLMIAGTAIFFEPYWPRRALHDLRTGHRFRSPAMVGGFILGFFIGALLPGSFSIVRALTGALGMAIAGYHLDEPFRLDRDRGRQEARMADPRSTLRALSPRYRFGLGLAGLWVAFQVLVPLRHYVTPGNVHWTEEGHNFAWHMKLRDKDSDGYFVVTSRATGETWEVDPGEYLTSTQEKKMTSRPEMIVEFARYLETVFEDKGYAEVEVRAVIKAELNGRTEQLLVDPEVDLTEVPYPWSGHADWILPLTVPLKSEGERPAS